MKRTRARLRLVAGFAVAATLSAPGAPAPRKLDPVLEPELLRRKAAAPRRVLRFVAIGDFGTGGAMQRAVAARMCRWRHANPFHMVVTTGDNVYPTGARKYFRARFMRPYRCLRRKGVRFRATLGNHDYAAAQGVPEIRHPAFGMRGRNYVLQRRRVRLVMFDSNTVNRRWLRRATRAHKARWTIVVFHHPVYSPGTGHGSTPGFRPWMPRLFRRRGVDLVLNGHDHIYAVSKRLRRIRYVVTGGGGAPLYGCSRPWFTRFCRERHHFLYVVARRHRINVKAVPPRGAPFGAFSTRGRR
jgi:3',5'-cyclic AMP phosphodiesterase CpdA